MSSEEELQKLSATIGIDLIKVKEKYDGITTRSVTEAIVPLPAQQQKNIESLKTLDKYSVCQFCQGSGIMKVPYNHMILEKNCSECGGEGILQSLETKVESILEAGAAAEVLSEADQLKAGLFAQALQNPQHFN